jgi:hypothetical protein
LKIHLCFCLAHSLPYLWDHRKIGPPLGHGPHWLESQEPSVAPWTTQLWTKDQGVLDQGVFNKGWNHRSCHVVFKDFANHWSGKHHCVASRQQKNSNWAAVCTTCTTPCDINLCQGSLRSQHFAAAKLGAPCHTIDGQAPSRGRILF